MLLIRKKSKSSIIVEKIKIGEKIFKLVLKNSSKISFSKNKCKNEEILSLRPIRHFSDWNHGNEVTKSRLSNSLKGVSMKSLLNFSKAGR
jgi:hypothetical protein